MGLLLILTQVVEEQRRLKHKLTPENAYFKAKNFDHITCAPKEELHQFLIGLYGEHILPATLHEFERLLRNDMYSMGVDAKGNQKYLITKTMMANIWVRLRDRLASIDSSTSMIEVTSDYAAHFFDMYVKNHDGKHMTGDRIKILLLNLPFMLRDLILPEVICIPHTFMKSFALISYMISYTISYTIAYTMSYTISYTIFCFLFHNVVFVWKVHMINTAITKAKPGSPLYRKPFVNDPSERLIETHVAALKWHMQSRKFEMTAATLKKLQDMSVSLLELLKQNLPVKSGEVGAWKFEKAHSILHKVRELILFGWSENTSTQGPEHCHIDFCKKVANCTNNKDVFLCILRHHVREGHLQYLQKLQADLACEDDSEEVVSPTRAAEDWLARNDSISCELGIRYPVLQAILSGHKNHQSLMASGV